MEKDKKIEHKIVQTFAGDMAEVIENDKEGLIKKIIHGEEEHEEEKKNLSPESKKNKLFMSIGIFLFFIALVTLSFLFFKKDIGTVQIEQQSTPLIFNDKSIFLEVDALSKDEIIQTVFNQVNQTEVKIGGVEGIYLIENKKIIGFQRFSTLIKSNLVFDEANFISDDFLMGSMLIGLKSTSPKAGDFFMLLKVSSILDVFNSMRTWEGKMFSILHGFFGINISSETNYLFTKEFQDGMVENKNARILYDQNENIVLMYVFADDNSIIIANSEPVVHEIMLRLASAQKKQ